MANKTIGGCVRTPRPNVFCRNDWTRNLYWLRACVHPSLQQLRGSPRTRDLNIFHISPTRKIASGSHVLPGGEGPLSKFRVFSTRKILWNFQKPICVYHPKKTIFFKNFFIPILTLQRWSSITPQKSFFLSPSFTRINYSYPLVDFSIKTSNY